MWCDDVLPIGEYVQKMSVVADDDGGVDVEVWPLWELRQFFCLRLQIWEF